MRALLAVLLFLAALTGASPALAEDPWTMIEVTGPEGTTNIRPEAVNVHGVVVGSALFPGRTHESPFRWEGGQMTELPLPSATIYDSAALDINDKGVIVGFYTYDINPADQYSNSAPKGLRWEGGGFTELPCCFDGVQPPAHGMFGSSGEGINEHGVISGTAWSGQDSNPFTWDGAIKNLSPAGQEATGAFGQEINESGTVAGYINIAPSDRGAVYKDGVRTIIPIVPGDNGLNDLGHVVGTRAYEAGKKQIAQMWDGETVLTLGVESTHSKANAINNSSWVVGRSGVEDYQPGGGTGFLWRPDVPRVTLNSLSGGGWNLESGTDINENGVIVGRGFHGTKQMGFMMVPAGVAYQITGTVTDGAGAKLAGVSIRVLRADGTSAGDPVKSDAEGRYTWTVPRGEYRVTALPEGGYGVVANPDCTIVTFHCDISVTRNRTVDFQAVPAAAQPDPQPPAAPGPVAPRPDLTGPVLNLPDSMKAKVDKKGALTLKLPAFAERVTGTVKLKAGKVTVGSAAFTALPGKPVSVKVALNKKGRQLLRRKRRLKTVATVTALDAAGNRTTETLKLTITRR